MKNTPYFIAGNSYEGCGHKHRSAQACLPCARRLNIHYAVWRSWLKAKVYRLVPGDRFASQEIKIKISPWLDLS